MSAIIGFTGALLMKLPGPLTGEQEKQLTTIRSSAEHLLSLIDGLLDLTRIESGNFELQNEAVDCKNVLDEVYAALRPMADIKGLTFQVKVPESLVLHTDRRALSRILINLANNGISFTERGVVHIAACQDCVNGQSLIAFSVSDTGIGIRPEDEAKVFQPFAQLGGASNRRKGAGLSLHLSQKLARMLGGRIELKSRLGKGSEFTLLLRPCVKVSPLPAVSRTALKEP